VEIILFTALNQAYALHFAKSRIILISISQKNWMGGIDYNV